MTSWKLVSNFITVALFSALTAANVYCESEPDCSRSSGSLPNPEQAANSENKDIPIEHIFVIMQENRSFDEYYGSLANSTYRGEIDGVSTEMFNVDEKGTRVHAYHEQNLCVADPHHHWEDEHFSWNQGANDQFVKRNGRKVMGFYTETDLPFYHALADQFSISDRYFCSTLTQTFPNRFFLYAGTSFGITWNRPAIFSAGYKQPTIFDRLDAAKVSWKYYSDGENYLTNFATLRKEGKSHFKSIKDFETDLATEKLPRVVYFDSKYDEHPPANVQLGQKWVSDRILAIAKSRYWEKSVIFLTYDENGGFFDHVSPPRACAPDNIKPHFGSQSISGGFDRYGFRVPLLVISPYAKHHYVSHEICDHGCILKFVETKFNLPALTKRDANARALLDMFDFSAPGRKFPAISPAVTESDRVCKKEAE